MTYNPDASTIDHDEDVSETLEKHSSPSIGHNSNPGGIAAERLKSFVERVERLEEEKAGIQEDIKEIFQEAKGTGFDVKIMRAIIRLRKKDRDERYEEQELIKLYADALGMDY